MKIIKRLQSSTGVFLTGLQTSLLVASILLFPAIYKHPKSSTTTRFKLLPLFWRPAAYFPWPPQSSSLTSLTTRLMLLPPSFLEASTLIFLATCWQLLDQPYYLAPAPASLLTANSLLFQPDPPPICSYLLNFQGNIYSPFKFLEFLRQGLPLLRSKIFWWSTYF